MIEFYHNKGDDMLKLGCTFPNLANICLHSSFSAKFYPFTGNDIDLLSKVRGDPVRGLSRVFTHKAVVDETHLQFHHCLQIDCWNRRKPTLPLLNVSAFAYRTVHKIWVSRRFAKIQAPSEELEVSKIWSCRTYNEWDRTGELRALTQQELSKRLTVSLQLGCVDIGTVFEAMDWFYHYCPCQEA